MGAKAPFSYFTMFRNLLITIILLGALILIYLYRERLITYVRAILAGIPLKDLVFPTPSGNTPTLPTNCTGGGDIQNKQGYLDLQKNAIGGLKFECKDAPFVAGGYGVWSLNPVEENRLPEALRPYYIKHPRNGLFYPEINLIQKFYAPQGKKRKWYYDYIYDYIGTFPQVDIFTDKTSLGFILNDNKGLGNNSWDILYNGSYRQNKSLNGYKPFKFMPQNITLTPDHVYDPFIKYANNYLGAVIYGTGDLWKRTNTSSLELFQPVSIILPKGSGNVRVNDKCENGFFVNNLFRESPFGELFWKNTIASLQGKDIYGACFQNGASDLIKQNLQGETLIAVTGTPSPVTIGGYLFNGNQDLNKGFYDYPVIVRADNKQGGKIDQYYYA